MAAELGQTSDPIALVPGAVAALDSLIAVWKSREEVADAVRERLDSVRTPDEWTGDAAENFDTRKRIVAGETDEIQRSFGTAARALDSYRSVLSWGQQQAQDAIERWDAAEEATRLARDRHDQQNLSGLLPNAFFLDPGALGRTQAQEILSDARDQVRTLGDQVAATIMGAIVSEASLGTPHATLQMCLTPEGLLDYLSTLSPEDLRAELAADPSLAGVLAQADPDRVATWWRGLEEDMQDALIEEMPAVIGNLDGVEYGDRDTANRAWLKEQIEEAKQGVIDARNDTTWQRDPYAHGAFIEDAQKRVDALENIQHALDKGGAYGVDRQLISLTSDNPPLAAISVGDLDAADNVTFAVPGMYATSEDMSGWTDSADNIQQAQSRVDPSRSHAVVAWMGYETPIPGTVWGMDHAEKGGPALDKALTGIGATRTVDPSLNVVGHSYGSTTAAVALSEGKSHVDTFVTVGSAGLPNDVDRASDVHADRVYSGQATDGSADKWAHVGRWSWSHSVDPTGDDFGATTFGTDSGGDAGTAVTDHGAHTETNSGYLDNGTESLQNVALATTGKGSRVTPDEN